MLEETTGAFDWAQSHDRHITTHCTIPPLKCQWIFIFQVRSVCICMDLEFTTLFILENMHLSHPGFSTPCPLVILWKAPCWTKYYIPSVAQIFVYIYTWFQYKLTWSVLTILSGSNNSISSYFCFELESVATKMPAIDERGNSRRKSLILKSLLNVSFIKRNHLRQSFESIIQLEKLHRSQN